MREISAEDLGGISNRYFDQLESDGIDTRTIKDMLDIIQEQKTNLPTVVKLYKKGIPIGDMPEIIEVSRVFEENAVNTLRGIFHSPSINKISDFYLNELGGDIKKLRAVANYVLENMGELKEPINYNSKSFNNLLEGGLHKMREEGVLSQEYGNKFIEDTVFEEEPEGSEYLKYEKIKTPSDRHPLPIFYKNRRLTFAFKDESIIDNPKEVWTLKVNSLIVYDIQTGLANTLRTLAERKRLYEKAPEIVKDSGVTYTKRFNEQRCEIVYYKQNGTD